MNTATASAFPESDPRHHTRKMGCNARPNGAPACGRNQSRGPPRAGAIRASAEVLGALAKAFEDYENKSEPAFRGRSG
jgi:hypothetical protein